MHERGPRHRRAGATAIGVYRKVHFYDAFGFLVDAGAEVLVVPAAWVAGPAKEDHRMTLVRARAIENTAYVLASGQTGPVSELQLI